MVWLTKCGFCVIVCDVGGDVEPPNCCANRLTRELPRGGIGGTADLLGV